jgi:hypothetical protein
MKRLKGLLGVKALQTNEALLIPRCKMIHTFGMQMSIGVFFIGPQGNVCHVVAHLKPYRMAYHWYAVAVIETTAFEKKDAKKWCNKVHDAYAKL